MQNDRIARDDGGVEISPESADAPAQLVQGTLTRLGRQTFSGWRDPIY
jgi:hypothetical protein